MNQSRDVGARYGRFEPFTHAPTEAKKIGANKLCIFPVNQHLTSVRVDATDINQFKYNLEKNGFTGEDIFVHASYHINCCEWNTRLRKKALDNLLFEMRLAKAIGASCVNVHLGSAPGYLSRDEALQNATEFLDYVLQRSSDIRILIENSECAAPRLGQFDDIRVVINQSNYAHRLGYSLNVSHAFAFGYLLSAPVGYSIFIQQLEDLLGLEKLELIFMNDSKTTHGSKIDAHENLGKGEMGMELLACFVNDWRLEYIPMILETPDSSLWKKEISFIKY